MSGGRFDYQQFRIDSIANEILDVIRENEDGYVYKGWFGGDCVMDVEEYLLNKK